MGLSCGASLVKYGIFIINLVIAVCGIGLIVVGAIPLFRIDQINAIIPEENPTLIPIAIVVLGSIIFIISFFGCCGAIQENQCMVSTYAFLLLVLVILQVVAAVFAFMYTSDVANAAEDGFNRLFRQAKDLNDQAAIPIVDGVQRGLQCCGTTGPSAWNAIIVPDSCCIEANGNCLAFPNAFQRGCSNVISQYVNDSGLLIAWFASVVAGFLLVGVIFSCCLANSIRNTHRRAYA